MAIKVERLDSEHSIFKDELTNDPIALVKVTSAPYRRSGKNYVASWHPHFVGMYPNANDLTNKNISNNSTLDSCKSEISNKAFQIQYGRKDPLKTTFVGTLVTPADNATGYAEVRHHQYQLHNDKNEHVATLYVNEKHDKQIGINDSVFNRGSYDKDPKRFPAYLEYHGDIPSKEQEAILNIKHPENTPLELIARAKRWDDTKHIRPDFVGKKLIGGTQIYSTHHAPQEALKRFTQHLNAKLGSRYSYTPLGELHGKFDRPLNDRYDSDHIHLIDASAPGEIHYHKISKNHPDSYSSMPLNDIIDPV